MRYTDEDQAMWQAMSRQNAEKRAALVAQLRELYPPNTLILIGPGGVEDINAVEAGGLDPESEKYDDDLLAELEQAAIYALDGPGTGDVDE